MNALRLDPARAFLDAAGWAGAHLSEIPGDASFRRYARVSRDGDRAILMDAPPEREDVRPFAAVAGYLAGQGFAAPAVLAGDTVGGFLLLEDLGDDSFTRCLQRAPADEAMLYGAAVDALRALHSATPPKVLPGIDGAPYALGRYDAAEMGREVDLFVDWYLPAVAGEDYAAVHRDGYRAAWRQPFAIVEAGFADAPVLVLRDYHVDNLMWRAGRSGIARVGLLDFQDALIGHRAYDLVSLTQDARRDVALELEAAMRARYGDDSADFAAAYAILGAQRAAKIIGIFTRLYRRDGKLRYLDHLPRLWRLIERDLAHPALAPVAAWFEAHVPAALRQTDPRAKVTS